jgi:hypothetical protein
MAIHEYQKQTYRKVGVVIAIIVLPIAGFFAGMQYQKQTSPATGAQNTSRFGGRMGAGLRDRAIGTVKSITATSIRLTSRFDNTDKTYTTNSDTTYKDGTADAQAADIKTGATVALTLDSNDNTKVKTITINPTMARPLDGQQPQNAGSTDMMIQ